jgi:hypothetical protein
MCRHVERVQGRWYKGLKKVRENVLKPGVSTETQTRHLRNAINKRYRLSKLVRQTTIGFCGECKTHDKEQTPSTGNQTGRMDRSVTPVSRQDTM